MKHLTKYKLFELKETIKDISLIKSDIFRFYSPIPNNRYRASSVIKKVLNGKTFNIFKEKEIKLDDIGYDKDSKLKNKLRFEEYLNTFLGEIFIDNGEGEKTPIKDTDTRGFNFEGLIAGFFDGLFNTDKKGTWDIKLKNGGRASIKFQENINESPTLTSIGSLYSNKEFKTHSLKEKEIINNLYGVDVLSKDGIKKVLNKIINSEEIYRDEVVILDSKKMISSIRKILEMSFKDVDIFITGSKEENNLTIQVYKKEDIIDNIFKVGLMGTRGSKHEIRIKSSKFTPINTIVVNLPKTTDDEVVDIYRGRNRDWADDIFGDWSGRIRTDFVDYFYDNRERICKSIKDYDEYNNKGYSND